MRLSNQYTFIPYSLFFFSAFRWPFFRDSAMMKYVCYSFFIIIVIVAVPAVPPLGLLPASERKTMDIIIEFLTDWGYLALFIAMVLENMNIPLPSEVILGFAGFLVSQDIFQFWPTVLVGTAAGVVGSLASYYIGLKGGRNLILRHTEKGGLGAKKLIAAKDWFENYGGIAVLTGRLLPGIRTFISLPAGIAQFPLSQFLILTLLGTLPWTIFLVYIGSELGENWTMILEYKIEIAVGAVLFSALIAGAFLIYRKVSRS